MKNKKRIVISGYYGFNNSGDDAILKAIVKDLREKHDNIEITALSNNYKSTQEIYNIKAISRFNITKVIKEIYKSDMLISGGGSLLQDVTSTRSIIYYLAIIFIAKTLKKPVMVYANGIGPIDKRVNRILTKKILNKVDIITLRDYNSKETLDEIDVKNKIHITSDPVFTLKSSPDDTTKKILQKENICTNKQMIGICIRDWKNINNLIEQLSKAISYMISKYNVSIVLIPMHYPEDLDISKEVKAKVNSESCYVIEGRYCAEDIMGIISKLEIIIAMRLHSLIYATTQSTPMIGLIYDPKVKSFLETIGQSYMCDVENLEFEELCKNIDDVWNDRENIKQNLLEKREDLKSKALENIDLALDILKRS